MTNFQSLRRFRDEDVEAALQRDDAEELRHVVIAVALEEPDWTVAHQVCLRLARHADPTVRGNALLGFGHLARRFGMASEEARALVNSGLTDSDPHVKAQSESAVDDIAMFTKTAGSNMR
jgi:hypothetical protein